MPCIVPVTNQAVEMKYEKLKWGCKEDVIKMRGKRRLFDDIFFPTKITLFYFNKGISHDMRVVLFNSRLLTSSFSIYYY